LKIETLKSVIIDYFLELDERERTVIVLGIPVLILILYISLVFFPLKGLESSYKLKSQGVIKESKEISKIISEFEELKLKVDYVERRIPSRSFNPSDYLEERAKAFGIQVKKIKVSSGKRLFDISSKLISLTFMDSNIDSIMKLIRDVELGKYPFKAVDLDVKDPDRDGLVSGKLDFVVFVKGES
jgi:hypothetical protein